MSATSSSFSSAAASAARRQRAASGIRAGMSSNGRPSGGSTKSQAGSEPLGWWADPENRTAQTKRLAEARARKLSPPCEALRVLMAEGLRSGEPAPLEAVMATYSSAAEQPPSQRLMTIFDFDHDGPVFFSNPGSKIDELRERPHCSMMFWFPKLGATAYLKGEVRIGELVPPPKVKPGEKPPCPCVKPAGFRNVLVLSEATIMRMRRSDGGFDSQRFRRSPDSGEWERE